VGEWFKDGLAQYIKDMLLSDKFASRGIFNAQRVEEMIDAHIASKENHTRALRALVAIELWFQIYIDSSDLTVPAD